MTEVATPRLYTWSADLCSVPGIAQKIGSDLQIQQLVPELALAAV